jgi:hypothetical protein
MRPVGSLAVLLAGCASAPITTGRWYGPSDPQRRAADEYECLRASSLGPGAPVVIPGVSTTMYWGNVATTIPGMPVVLPGSPERDSEIYEACLRSKGWEYRMASAPRPLSEVVAALDAVEATEAKQPKRQEPHPVPATPSDPHPTTATAGTPWRLVLLEKKGSERASETVSRRSLNVRPPLSISIYRSAGNWRPRPSRRGSPQSRPSHKPRQTPRPRVTLSRVRLQSRHASRLIPCQRSTGGLWPHHSWPPRWRYVSVRRPRRVSNGRAGQSDARTTTRGTGG